MTDNEKAATFIGWTPLSTDRRCDICGAIESDVEPQWGLGHLFSPPALLPVPDMSRPENYMRALEAIAADGGHYSISAGIWPQASVQIAHGHGCDGIAERQYEAISRHTNVGEAARTALAAVYDAEHATGTEAEEEQSIMTEMAWVIEREDSSPGRPVYFCLGGPPMAKPYWSLDHCDALRFARRCDALDFMFVYLERKNHRVAEHGWCAP